MTLRYTHPRPKSSSLRVLKVPTLEVTALFLRQLAVYYRKAREVAGAPWAEAFGRPEELESRLLELEVHSNE